MKKILIGVLVVLAFVFTACGGGGGAGAAASGEGGPEVSPQEIPEGAPDQETEDSAVLPTTTETEIAEGTSPLEKEQENEAKEELEDEILIAEAEDDEVELVPGSGAVVDKEDESDPELDVESEEPAEETVEGEDVDEDQVAESEVNEEETTGSEEAVAQDDSTESGETVDQDDSTESEETVAQDTEEEPLVEGESDDFVAELEETEEEESLEELIDDLASNLALKGTDMTADLSFGKWYEVENERLPFYDTSEYQSLRGEYQAVKSELKGLRQKLNEERKVVNEYRKDLRVDKKNFKAAEKALKKAEKEAAKNGTEVDATILEAFAAAEEKYLLSLDAYTENKDIYLATQDKRKEKAQELKRLRAELGYGKKQRGLTTYWANQDIILNMNDINKSGWYELSIDAMNNPGSIPESYGAFNISVRNDLTGENIGGMQIPASDEKYQRGKMYVYLEEGDNRLSIRWTNDYYKKGQYDANINISRISLGYSKSMTKQYEKGIRTANHYSEVDGRFFWDSESVHTYWAGQTIGFEYKDLEPGKYKIVVQAKNYGSLGLPDTYENYEIDIEASTGESVKMNLPASDEQYKTARAELSLQGGDTTIYLTWLNDAYKKDVYDANIQYKKIRLVRTGDLDDSALTAYLLGTQSGNRMILIFAFIIISVTAAAISIFHKKNNAA